MFLRRCSFGLRVRFFQPLFQFPTILIVTQAFLDHSLWLGPLG